MPKRLLQLHLTIWMSSVRNNAAWFESQLNRSYHLQAQELFSNSSVMYCLQSHDPALLWNLCVKLASTVRLSELISECLPTVTVLSRHPGIKFSLIYSPESPVIKRLTTALWRRRRTRARHFNCQPQPHSSSRKNKNIFFKINTQRCQETLKWDKDNDYCTWCRFNYNSAQLMLNCSQMFLFIPIRLQQRLEFENGHQGKNLFVLWGGGEAVTGLGADPFVFVSVFVFIHLYF